MAKHVIVFGSHHLHPHPSPTTESITTCSPSFSTFPSLSSQPLISILRSSPSSIPSLNHEDGRLQNDDHLSSLHLQPICSEDHFNRVVDEAQLRQHALLLVWICAYEFMCADKLLNFFNDGNILLRITNWCRKCIYLKPKLEKLAVDYYPRLQFYSVDVNAVSHKLIARAGVTKMPTIQLWKDSKKQAEVIGGNKSYFVINEVQEMIENDFTI